MTEDPNKRQNDPTQSGGQNNPQQGQKPGHSDDSSQKRPSQGGTDAERDRDKQEQGGQRRAS